MDVTQSFLMECIEAWIWVYYSWYLLELQLLCDPYK